MKKIIAVSIIIGILIGLLIGGLFWQHHYLILYTKYMHAIETVRLLTR